MFCKETEKKVTNNAAQYFACRSYIGTKSEKFRIQREKLKIEVFSKIVEMGVPTERVSITASTSTSAQAEEVHIYLKN